MWYVRRPDSSRRRSCGVLGRTNVQTGLNFEVGRLHPVDTEADSTNEKRPKRTSRPWTTPRVRYVNESEVVPVAHTFICFYNVLTRPLCRNVSTTTKTTLLPCTWSPDAKDVCDSTLPRGWGEETLGRPTSRRRGSDGVPGST